mgnify:CR=1 FL=1
MRFIILLLSFNLFSNSNLDQSWFDSQKIKWPSFNEEGYSKVKITQKNLDPLLNIIKETSYKSKIYSKNGSLINPDLLSKIYACKFRANIYGKKEITAQFGLTVNRSAEDQFNSKIKNLDDKRQLLKITDLEERKKYLIEEIFELKYDKNFNYEIKQTKSLMKARINQPDQIICIDHKLSIYDATSTLVHELIHFNNPTSKQYSIKQLKDETVFNELYFNEVGSEYDAFRKQCEFEQELRAHKVFARRSISPCMDSDLIDKAGMLNKDSLRKIFLDDYEMQILYTRYSHLFFMSNGLLMDSFELSRGAIQTRSKIKLAKIENKPKDLEFYEELLISIKEEKSENSKNKIEVDNLIKEIEDSLK